MDTVQFGATEIPARMPYIGEMVIYKNRQTDPIPGVLSNYPALSPAVVVAVWGTECVNLKVIDDGDRADLWVTSATKAGKEWQEGQWNYIEVLPV